VKAAHEDAASQWSVGWSHGKEALRSGLKDTHKGSFYANPLQVRGCCAGRLTGWMAGWLCAVCPSG
jgi:hypothetical protein